MFNLKFSLAALLLEIGSWTSLHFLSDRDDLSLFSYLIIHGLACAILAFSIYPLLWGTRSHPKWAVISLIFCVSFLIPAAGFIAVVLGILLIRIYPLQKHTKEFSSIKLPDFDEHQTLHAAGRTIGMRKLLSNQAAPIKNRFTALVSLNHVTGNVSAPLLRDVLNDVNDDLRLLAYGMLDRMEQKISLSIHNELKIWKQEQLISNNKKQGISSIGLSSAQRLSDLYWELIYQGLAQDDMREFAVKESLFYCDEVLRYQPRDGALLLRKGRLLHSQGKLAEADTYYNKALELGIPKTQVIPYLAEIFYEKGNFKKVRELMHAVKVHNSLPKLRPIIDYWS